MGTPTQGTAKPIPVDNTLLKEIADELLSDLNKEIKRIKRLTRKFNGRSYTRLFERIYKLNNSINLYR